MVNRKKEIGDYLFLKMVLYAVLIIMILGLINIAILNPDLTYQQLNLAIQYLEEYN